MNLWIDRIAAIIILAFAIGWCIKIIRDRRKLTNTISHPGHSYTSEPKVVITPEPVMTVVDRREYLQARMAYLAHMRDVGIEVYVEDPDYKGPRSWENGEPIEKKKIVRSATPKEMLELVNMRDEEHVAQLLDTWDQARERTKDSR